MTHQVSSDIVNEQQTHYLSRNDFGIRWGQALPLFLSLQGLREFWPCGPNRHDGSTNYITGLANGFHLTNINNGQIKQTTGQLIPNLDLNGSTQYLAYGDNAQFDITGAEADVSPAGLTLGGWFQLDSLAGSPTLMSNHDNATGAGSAYLLYLASSQVNFTVYNSSTGYNVANTTAISANWVFAVGRYRVSNHIAAFVNGVKATNTSGIPATINNSAVGLQIGARNGANLMDGRAALCFICAAALTDEMVLGLYEQTRLLFT